MVLNYLTLSCEPCNCNLKLQKNVMMKSSTLYLQSVVIWFLNDRRWSSYRDHTFSWNHASPEFKSSLVKFTPVFSWFINLLFQWVLLSFLSRHVIMIYFYGGIFYWIYISVISNFLMFFEYKAKSLFHLLQYARKL